MTLRGTASRLIFLTLSAIAFFAGCSQRGSLEVLSEDEDPIFRRARDLYARGMENEALENFLKLIQRRNGSAPESHLDAGNIYLKHLRDPISAIYHFKHYEALMQRSDREDAETRIALVQERIKSAKKEFALTFDAKVYKDPLERLKLLESIEALRSENEVLKRQLTDARTRLNSDREVQVAQQASEEPLQVLRAEDPVRLEPLRPEPTPQPPAQPAGRTYQIKPGDSLYKISRQVYGNGSRWRDILEANRDVISNEKSLKAGATIRIP